MEKLRFNEGDKIISIGYPDTVYDDFACYRDHNGEEMIELVCGVDASVHPASEFELYKPVHRESQLKILLDGKV